MGIRGRSFIAFTVLTIFTLLASMVGWVSYQRIESELEQVVQVNMRSLTLMADLKEYGTRITISAPTLLTAKDGLAHQNIKQDLDQNVKSMLGLLEQEPSLADQTIGLNSQSSDILVKQIALLQDALAGMGENVTKQLSLDSEKQLFSQELRWQASTFVSDIDLIIKRLELNWRSKQLSIGADLQVLYRIKADANLLANLVDRVQYLPDLSSLIAINLHVDEVIASLKSDLKLLSNLDDYEVIEDAVENFIALAHGENNIFSIRRQERNLEESGQLQLSQLHSGLSGLNALLSEQEGAAKVAAQTAVDTVQSTIRQGQTWAIFLVGGSLLFSILIVWLYVGHNLVSRITSLNASMRAIAKGNLQQEVSIDGSDEIGAMARSLRSFRDQLSTLQEELVQSGRLAAVGQLSAGIAHEINQPLSAIRHYTHNTGRLIQAGRHKEAEENLTHINLLTQRIITTITQLKSLSKGEQVDFVVVEVEPTIENALLLLSGDNVLAETTLNIDISNQRNQVYADPVQLEQVIRNLITNALDAMAETPNKTIQITSARHEDMIEIKVSDNGKGIPKELRKQVFDPFFTTKQRGQSLGLGLSIAYSIIKRLGGKLSIDEAQEVGATFCIQLPIYQQGSHEQSEQ